MWTNNYNPTEKGWYLVKINGKKDPLSWNIHNKFWSDFAGKTYRPDQIDCWLDDTKINSCYNKLCTSNKNDYCTYSLKCESLKL